MSVQETFVDENFLKFSFKVENFTKDNEEILRSEFVNFAEGTWRIKVLSLSNQEEDYIGIYVRKCSDIPTNVRLNVSITDTHDKVIKAEEIENKKFENDSNCRGWSKFISKNDLFKAISPDFTFNVVCKLTLKGNIKATSSSNFYFSDELKYICSTNFHDLKIQVEDQVIQAHRNIVSAYSPVLYQQILNLGDANLLKIDDFKFEIVQKVINFVYKDEAGLTDENVREILLAAKKYQIEDLQTDCENYIFQKISVENAFETLIFADQNQIENLCKKTVTFVKKDIDVFLKMPNQWQKFFTEHPTAFTRLFEKVVPSFCDNLNNNKESTSENLVNDKTPEYNSSSTNLSNEFEKMLIDYEKLFETMDLSDVVLEIEGKVLSAHKCLLLSRSTVFRAMFTHDTLESKENRIEITDINYDTMKQLLQYIYCGKVTGLKENAVNLFSAADKYNLMELKNLCKSSMKQNITVDNFSEIMKLADLHPPYLTDLKEIAMKFFKKNFYLIFKETDWKDFAVTNPQILNEMLIKFMESKK